MHERVAAATVESEIREEVELRRIGLGEIVLILGKWGQGANLDRKHGVLVLGFQDSPPVRGAAGSGQLRQWCEPKWEDGTRGEEERLGS